MGSISITTKFEYEERIIEKVLTKAIVEQKALKLINTRGKVKIGDLMTATLAEETALKEIAEAIRESNDNNATPPEVI